MFWALNPDPDYLPLDVKLKSGGRGLWLGNLVWGSRNSLKKLWAHASNGDILAEGVYSNKRLHNVMASGGVFGRNTWKEKSSNRTWLHGDMVIATRQGLRSAGQTLLSTPRFNLERGLKSSIAINIENCLSLLMSFSIFRNL